MLQIVRALATDIQELYDLQLLSFESEAEMIGSRLVPALMESADHFREDFPNWETFKMIEIDTIHTTSTDTSCFLDTSAPIEDMVTHSHMNGNNSRIIGAIRYRREGDIVDVGRLMIHPDYRHRGLAQQLLSFVDEQCAPTKRSLYTCTKSWINIRLYEKMGYVAVKEEQDTTGLSFVYMEKV